MCTGFLIKNNEFEKCYLIKKEFEKKSPEEEIILENKNQLFGIDCPKCFGNTYVCSTLWALKREKMISWRLHYLDNAYKLNYINFKNINCRTFAYNIIEQKANSLPAQIITTFMFNGFMFSCFIGGAYFVVFMRWFAGLD
jgi:hypothetical protein